LLFRGQPLSSDKKGCHLPSTVNLTRDITYQQLVRIFLYLHLLSLSKKMLNLLFFIIYAHIRATPHECNDITSTFAFRGGNFHPFLTALSLTKLSAILFHLLVLEKKSSFIVIHCPYQRHTTAQDANAKGRQSNTLGLSCIHDPRRTIIIAIKTACTI
jgi:hypothetical protein